MKSMTNEEVNEFERHIRNAQAELEEAGRMICSVRGAGLMWNQITQMASDVGDLTHETYKLRPEE